MVGGRLKPSTPARRGPSTDSNCCCTMLALASVWPSTPRTTTVGYQIAERTEKGSHSMMGTHRCPSPTGQKCTRSTKSSLPTVMRARNAAAPSAQLPFSQDRRWRRWSGGTATIDMNGDDVQQSRERSQEFHIDLSLGARTRRRCAAPSVESRAVLADAQVSTVRSRRQPVGLLWSPQDHSLGGETRSPSHDFGRESSAHEHGAVRDTSSLPTPGPSFVETQGWAQASANYTAGRTSISSDETSRTA